MQPTQEQLQKRYETLPEDLKQAIYSVETADTIQKVSKKYNLMIDQMGELAAETGLLMLGFTGPKDYIKNISARAGIDIETAKKIAEEINREVFSKVKEHLKQLHGLKDKAPSETKFPTPTGPAVTTLELTQKHKPNNESTSIFHEKIQEQPFRQTIQTTEIKPEKPEINPPNEKYLQEDPYRESLEK